MGRAKKGKKIEGREKGAQWGRQAGVRRESGVCGETDDGGGEKNERNRRWGKRGREWARNRWGKRRGNEREKRWEKR